jgi:membrane associated rhomboid family serine protease
MNNETQPSWLRRFIPIIALVSICWLVFGLDSFVLHDRLTQHGIVPRRLSSLPGIVWAPFVHASFRHLAANTLPLLLLGAIICGRSRAEFAAVTVGGIILGGGLTWLMARNASHIGASGLILCYFGYLSSMALFRRTFGTLCISVVCILGYGGIIRGILPGAGPVSWESHLCGLIAGVALAWFVANLKKEQEPRPSLAMPGGLKS